MKFLKIGIINIAVFSGIILTIELSLNVTKSTKHGVKQHSQIDTGEIYINKPIPTSWRQVFHPGVGHSHQKSEFIENPNTSTLAHDNLSVTEVFQSQNGFDSEFKILALGGSTTDPLGTQFSGYRGTWVHHLFEALSQSNHSRYVVDNAANGGSTSSNELLRLITKLHSNHYDLAISFNGINEIYFANNPHLEDRENVLASSMLLFAMRDSGIIKGLDKKKYTAEEENLFALFKKSKTYLHLINIQKKLKGPPVSPQFTSISEKDKKMLVYGANVWAKNIDFMNSVSQARNSKYLAILQPTLGIGGEYCSIGKECMLSKPRYIARINFLYSLLRESCSTREYCLDISSDHDLISNDSLYTDPRHPNNEGNKKIAKLIRNRVSQILND